MHLKAQDIAKLFDSRLEGDPQAFVDSIDDIKGDKPNSLSFINDPSYLKYLKESRSNIILIDEKIDYSTSEATSFLAKDKRAFVIVKNSYIAFVKMMYKFIEEDDGGKKNLQACGSELRGFITGQTGSKDNAANSGVNIEASAVLYPNVFVGENVSVGARTIVYPGVVLLKAVSIGADCIIYPNVSIYSGSVIGNRVIIGASTVIGSDGFGFVKDDDGVLLKVPHIGGVVIEDEVEIGSNTSIDRGTVGNTVIKKASKVDNLVQIAHNCKLGENNILCGMVGLSGSTVLGDNVIMGAGSGTKGHIKIGDNCVITARTSVSKDLAPGSQVKGMYPARPLAEELKIQTLVGKLPELYERIKKLEKEKKSNG
jgi:UDP-3-O-[3-hydroxymyristoyl] glucosamine N-acyltransferase